MCRNISKTQFRLRRDYKYIIFVQVALEGFGYITIFLTVALANPYTNKMYLTDNIKIPFMKLSLCTYFVCVCMCVCHTWQK